jgi:hypothetical protein
MKNIHVIPTDKPSRLHTYRGVLNFTVVEFVAPTIVQKNVLINLNIYITSDEEIKEGDWIFNEELEPSILKCSGKGSLRGWNKIILTTNTNLIKDSVQVIDDKFLEWFVKNPNCEKIEIKTRYLHYYKTIETFISFSKTPEFSSRNMQCIKIEPRYEIIIPQEEPKRKIDTCYNFDMEIGCVQDICRCEQEEPKQENCCTPAGQIKRYVDCVGCDKKEEK